jgi:hypothetical protein
MSRRSEYFSKFDELMALCDNSERLIVPVCEVVRMNALPETIAQCSNKGIDGAVAATSPCRGGKVCGDVSVVTEFVPVVSAVVSADVTTTVPDVIVSADVAGFRRERPTKVDALFDVCVNLNPEILNPEMLEGFATEPDVAAGFVVVNLPEDCEKEHMQNTYWVAGKSGYQRVLPLEDTNTSSEWSQLKVMEPETPPGGWQRLMSYHPPFTASAAATSAPADAAPADAAPADADADADDLISLRWHQPLPPPHQPMPHQPMPSKPPGSSSRCRGRTRMMIDGDCSASHPFQKKKNNSQI